MPGRNLPIQFFTHRDGIDERRTEGGGGEEYKWILPETLLIKKAEQLVSELNSFKTTIAERENKKSIIPFVFKACLRDNATAKYKSVLLMLNLPFLGQAYKVCQEPAFCVRQYSCLLFQQRH